MNKSKFTPGPWRATRLGGSVQDDTGKVVAFVHDDVPPGTRKANANLIAAALDLLAALKPFAAQPVTDDAPCHVHLTTKEKCGRCSQILAARAAIAKVEGEIR